MDLYRSVVITGGSGMLAHELDHTLRARGITPILATRNECDISHRDQVAKLFQEQKPTLLINCAAHTAVDKCEDEPDLANAINGDGPANLASLAKEFGTRLVHFSTDFVFSGQNDRPYRPDDAPAPVSAYGRSKLLGEERIAQVAPPAWLTIRTSWLFGRHGNCFPQIMIDRARSGHPLRVVNDQVGCPTYAPDLAHAVLELLDRGAKGMWHITNSSPTNWYAFACEILRQFSIPTEVAPISTQQWVAMRPRQAQRPAYSVLDISAYKALTGQNMRDWHEALRDYRTECEKGS